jgi:hypothetical protein
MNRREAQKVLDRKIAAVLGPEFRPPGEGFVRRFKGGADFLFVGFWVYPPHFVFSATPAVRLDVVEKLFRRVFDVDIKQTTVCTELWRFDSPTRPAMHVPLPNSGSPYFFTFTDEATAGQVVDQLRPRLSKTILPYYERIRTAADAHRALNVEMLDTGIGRISHGLVAAFLADKSGWRDVAVRYAAELAAWSPADQERFRVAVERLAAMEQ